MWNARLVESQAGIKTAGWNINDLYADDTTLMAESKEELRASWGGWKRRVKKTGLKLNVQKIKIMASGLITSWQTEGEKVEAVTDFIFLGGKSPVDSDRSHNTKRHLPLGSKAMTNLDSVLKSRVVTLPTKVHIVRAMVLPVVMHGCESKAIKKAEWQRIDAFKL